jgi:hypothetical protein
MTEWDKVASRTGLTYVLIHFRGMVWVLSVWVFFSTTCSKPTLATGLDGRILNTM